MTAERQQYWKEQIHAALAEHDDRKVAALNTSLTIEVAECMAHQSQRGKETLAICKEIKDDIAHLKTHHDDDTKEMREKIRNLEDHNTAMKHRFEGAKLLWAALRYIAAAGGGAAALKLITP